MKITNIPTNYDFDSLLNAMIVFLRTQEEFANFNFEGSAIKQVMRLLAYDSQQRAFLNNFIFNELNLDSAQLRENVSSLANCLGYMVQGKVAAKFIADIIVTPTDVGSAPSTLVMDKETTFFSSNSDYNIVNFSPSMDYSANLVNGVYTFSNVKLLQGIWNIASYRVETQYGVEAYTIPDANVDPSTLKVIVKPNEDTNLYDNYNQFKTGYDLGVNEKVFYSRVNRNNLYQIEFGDGVISFKPDYGNIVVIEYLVTLGSAGNNVSLLSPSGAIGNYFNIQVVPKTNNYSFGGFDEEDVDVIRNIAPKTFAASGNAVTASDYAAITKMLYPSYQSVTAWGGEDNNPPRYGYVYISIKPSISAYLSQSEKDDVVESLKKYNVGSIDPIIADPDYVYLNVSTIVKYNPKLTILNSSVLSKKIYDGINTFSNTVLEQFGVGYDQSSLSEYINDIDDSIISNKTRVSYEKRFIPELNVSSVYTFNFNSQLKPSSIRIEGFTVPDIEPLNYYYIEDDGNGRLSMKYVNVDTELVSVYNPDIGTVDYQTGLIGLDSFSPNSVIDAYVSVTADSGSYDNSINSFNNFIIEIADVNVTVEL